MVHYRFWFRKPDNKEISRDFTGETFADCLAQAKEEAKTLNAKIIAWDKLDI